MRSSALRRACGLMRRAAQRLRCQSRCDPCRRGQSLCAWAERIIRSAQYRFLSSRAPFQVDLKIAYGRTSFSKEAGLSKEGGEVEQPEKAKEQREDHGQERVQPVRTDQKFR